MGYYSNVVNFQQEPFTVDPSVTPERLKRALDDCGSDWGEYLEYWFDLEIDETGELTLEPTGESGKAYELDELMDALVDILITLEAGPGEKQGFRFSYELWGEEPGDAVLYKSDGVQLYRIAGKIEFLGKAVAVRGGSF